jgi:hypothetical protein
MPVCPEESKAKRSTDNTVACMKHCSRTAEMFGRFQCTSASLSTCMLKNEVVYMSRSKAHADTSRCPIDRIHAVRRRDYSLHLVTLKQCAPLWRLMYFQFFNTDATPATTTYLTNSQPRKPLNEHGHTLRYKKHNYTAPGTTFHHNSSLGTN